MNALSTWLKESRMGSNRLLPAVLHTLDCFIAGERDEPEPVSQELITEHCTISFQLDPINSYGWGLSNHHASK